MTPEHKDLIDVVREAADLLRRVRVLDCGAHYCRYCPAKSPAWEHTTSCPYVESQREQTRARQVADQLLHLTIMIGELADSLAYLASGETVTQQESDEAIALVLRARKAIGQGRRG